MSRSKHLWPDPASEITWEVWSEDTFDREARPTIDSQGRGLLDGLSALWMRFLLETVRPEGNEGFTRFYLRRPDVVGVRVTGPWEGAVRLRQWVFDAEKREIQEHLNSADRWLFEALISTHAQLLLAEQTSEPILAIAAEPDDKQEFKRRLGQLAASLGFDLTQVSRNEVGGLVPLVYSEKRATQQARKPAPPSPQKSEERRKPMTASKRTRSRGDSWLLGAAAFLLIGFVILIISGLGFRLTCERLEPSLLECRHENQWLGLITLTSQPVEDLWRARVGQVCDEDGCSQFPELDTAAGPIRLEGISSSKLEPNQEIVDQVNAYLADSSERDLEIAAEFKPGRLIIPLALILAAFGFFVAWLTGRPRKARPSG